MGKKGSSSKTKNGAYRFNLNRIQLFLLTCGALLSCGLCFSLGLMLGYQLSGSSLKKQLPSRGEVDSWVKKSRESSFYETLVEPTKERPTPPKPQTKAKTTTKTIKSYAIQVAAFKNKKSAYRLRNELKKSGYPAYVIPSAKGNAEKWFRVRLGKYATRPQAQAAAEQLKQQTKLKPFIVR